MASDELRHAAKQEAWDATSSMRTDDDQIGTPLFCGIDNFLPYVSHLDRGFRLEPHTTHLARNSLDQLMCWFLLVVQFRSVAWSHLRGCRCTRLQHMQDPNLYMLRAKLRDNGL
jgi:hypothetical protein